MKERLEKAKAELGELKWQTKLQEMKVKELEGRIKQAEYEAEIEDRAKKYKELSYNELLKKRDSCRDAMRYSARQFMKEADLDARIKRALKTMNHAVEWELLSSYIVKVRAEQKDPRLVNKAGRATW